MRGLENLYIFIDSEVGSVLSTILFPSISLTLQRLNIRNCDFKDLAQDGLSSLINLKTLEIEECQNCSHINLDFLPHLEWLCLQRESSKYPFFYRLNENLRIFSIKDSDFLISEVGSKTLQEFQHEKLLLLEIEFKNWTLTNDWLSGFPYLKSLQILFPFPFPNVIPLLPDIASKVFPKLPIEVLVNLESLSLPWCKFESINHLNTKSLKNLKILYLQGNKVDIDMNRPDIFTGLEGLIQLKIRFTKIKLIHKNAFRGLHSLQCLDLFSNCLSELNPAVFSHIPNLKHLDLSDNQLELEESLLFNLKHLETLKMDSNNFGDSIPRNFFLVLVNLEELHLSMNQITRIESNMFKGLSKLKRLVLDYNQLEDIPLNAFSFSICLEQVNVQYNLFSNLKKDELEFQFLPIKIIF